MDVLSKENLQRYRQKTFHLAPDLRLHTQEQAIAFVRERGFVYFWPITGIVFPSLWNAAAGDRPVADEHDDPGHITWRWKDGLLGGREWYYAKVLRKKSTMIAMELAPYFYALTENYGSPEEDYLTLYEQGRLTVEAKLIYEALLDHGPLDTIELRRRARLSAPGSEGRFNKAIGDLQANFNIVPVAVTNSGAWHYAFAYDVVTRRYPELPELAHDIGDAQAQQTLLTIYFRSLGAATLREAGKLFNWRAEALGRATNALVKVGVLQPVTIEGQTGEFFAIADLA